MRQNVAHSENATFDSQSLYPRYMSWAPDAVTDAHACQTSLLSFSCQNISSGQNKVFLFSCKHEESPVFLSNLFIHMTNRCLFLSVCSQGVMNPSTFTVFVSCFYQLYLLPFWTSSWGFSITTCGILVKSACCAFIMSFLFCILWCFDIFKGRLAKETLALPRLASP